jgi:hypothetical protein
MRDTILCNRELTEEIREYMKTNGMEGESLSTAARALIRLGLKEAKRRNNIG